MILNIRGRLDTDLSLIRDKIAQLGSLVDVAIEQSMDALLARDLEQARAVQANDAQINALRYEIEQECLRILATQYPAATDLRLVLAATHIAIELERMGDHAAGIASLVGRMETDPDIESFHKLPNMTKRARKMVREGVRAFLEQDLEVAEKMISRDAKLNKHYVSLFHEMIGGMRSEDGFIRRGTFLLWIGHNLERIGDRATNIAERVQFLISGEFPDPYVDIDDS